MPHGRHENASFPPPSAHAKGGPGALTAAYGYRERAARLRVPAAESPDPLIRAYP